LVDLRSEFLENLFIFPKYSNFDSNYNYNYESNQAKPKNQAYQKNQAKPKTESGQKPSHIKNQAKPKTEQRNLWLGLNQANPSRATLAEV
jgi:hypothetical protein